MSVKSNYTVSELRHLVQKTAPEADHETYIGKSIRFFSVFFTSFFAKTNFTANGITTISVVMFFIGISLFALHQYFFNLLGVAIIYLSIICDACDGEIARLKGNKSGVGGIYVEPVSHDLQYGYMFFPLSLGVYLSTGSVFIVYVAFIGAVTKLSCRFLKTRFWYVVHHEADSSREDGEEKSQTTPSRVSFLHRVYKFFNRNIFSSVGLPAPLLFFSLIDRIDLFIYFFSGGFVLIYFANLIKQMRYIRSLG